MDKLNLLSISNISRYVKEKVIPVLNLKNLNIISVKEIEENTQVNYVYEVVFEQSGSQFKIYLKQATGKIKIKRWDFPINRIQYEVIALKKFRQILGEQVVPEVILFDIEKHLLVMSDIRGANGKLLIDEFAEGKIHPETGNSFGNLVGKLHGKTFGTKETIRTFEDENWIKNFIYNFKTVGAVKFKEVEVKQLIDESEALCEKCILGVDFADKNIFVERGDVRFCDFEAVFLGDPAFDVGHVLAHYLLQLENDASLLDDICWFFKDFMKNYRSEMKRNNVPDTYIDKLDQRTVKYIGVFMLHRSHGKSPYIFFKAGIEEFIKEDSIKLIEGSFGTPEMIFEKMNFTKR